MMGSSRKTALLVCAAKFSLGFVQNSRMPAPALRRRSYARSQHGKNGVVTASMAPLVATSISWAVPTVLATLGALIIKRRLDRPSRPYDRDTNSVGREYDAWTREGILEHYWGEHIHLGYYTDDEMKRGYLRKDFVEAKYNFTERMMEWGGVNALATQSKEAIRILDVGCGIGGTTRYMAKKLGPRAEVVGITLSEEQAKRASALAMERDIPNARFEVMDALDMAYENDSFDIVWGCESGEHMPDKGDYIREMTRVLKPGGNLVVATWCQRHNETQSFTAEEERALDFLYSEWTRELFTKHPCFFCFLQRGGAFLKKRHVIVPADPYFISIKDYEKIMTETNKLATIQTDDWTTNTIASWRHSIWVGVFDPWPVVFAGPRMWWKCLRDGICLERMHRAFKRGLMEYGMLKATKIAPPAVA